MGKPRETVLVEDTTYASAQGLKYDPTIKSLLTDEQNEELRLILSKPIEIASDEEMREVFEDWDD
jgi:hypothetical protein